MKFTKYQKEYVTIFNLKLRWTEVETNDERAHFVPILKNLFIISLIWESHSDTIGLAVTFFMRQFFFQKPLIVVIVYWLKIYTKCEYYGSLINLWRKKKQESLF